MWKYRLEQRVWVRGRYGVVSVRHRNSKTGAKSYTILFDDDTAAVRVPETEVHPEGQESLDIG